MCSSHSDVYWPELPLDVHWEEEFEKPIFFSRFVKDTKHNSESWREPEPGADDMRSVSVQLCISVYTKCTFLEALINIFSNRMNVK